MKKLISIVLCLAVLFSTLSGLTVFAQTQDVSNETSYSNETFLDIFKKDSTLAWYDEFEGNTVDESKWEIAKGWGRAGETWSTQEDGNVTVSDGCLKLRAYEKATSEFTNGKAKTKLIQSGEVSSKAAWSEGLIEVRAKLPKGKGVYPAIWTMGRDYTINSCSWPWSGEIDIMEAVGTANKDKANCSTWQTLHTSRPFKKIGGNANDAHVATSVGEYKTPHEVPLNDDFHTFWCYMDGSIMIIGVDEYMMNIKDLNDPNLACFKDWEQWLILGLQMGSLAGTPERTDFSVWEMLVDYVRVYRLEDIKDYEKYQIFEAESLEHIGNVETNYMPCAQKCVVNTSSSDMSIYLDEVQAGNYDIMIDYVSAKNGGYYDAYMNGVKTSTIDLKADYNAQMKYTYIGSVTLEEDCSFQMYFDFVSGSRLFVDKVFLIKTDKKSDVVINKENALTTSRYIEVSSQEELKSATMKLQEKGTIKLLEDITLTEKIYTFNEPTIDLNGKTLTVNGGYFAIGDENKPTIIKNGNVVISGNSTNFINTKENNYNAKVKCEDLNITINSTASWGYVFNHNYASIGIEANNCEFSFGEKVSGNSTYIISKNAGIYNNCTFNLNGRKAFLMSNGSNTSSKKLYFNNCVVNDALYLFHSDNALTNYVDIKLANTTINNLTALTNFEENAQFVSVADYGVLKQNGETVGISADMTGSFTMECDHYYIDATCVAPKHCEYCNSVEGEALGHISDGGKITRQADCYYPEITKYTCTECGEVLEEKETAPIKGHEYKSELLGENTCTTMRYYKYSCENCDYYYTDAADTDISGAYTIKGHTVDESTKVEFSSCVNHDGYYYTCAECGKENLKYIEHIGTHDIYSTNFTAPTETTAGSVTYKCNTCDFNKTKTIKAGEHIVTVDGVKYFTVDSCFFTPYQYDEAFFCYVDEDGNKYGSDALVKTDKDITLTKTTIDIHTHISDGTLNNVVPPTCSEKGYTEHICEICKKIYKTDFVDETNEHILEFDKTIDPTCTEKGYTAYTCKHCTTQIKQEYVDALGHTEVVDKGYDATCTEKGLTDGLHCERDGCKAVLVKQQEIDALGHTEVVTKKGVAPTCTLQGITDEICCSVCNVKLQERTFIPAKGHKYTEKITKKATCGENGIKTYTCDCGYTKTESIPKTNEHNCKGVVTKKATCSKTGVKTYSCKCGYSYTKKIAATNSHKYKWTTTKKATCFAKGTSSYKCTTCGKVAKTKSIAKLTLKKPTVKYTAGKKNIAVKYTKVTGATGFQVRYRLTNSKKWKTVTFKTSKSATKYIKNLKKSKKYYLQTRAYIQSGSKKAYSSWTTRKTIKAK